MYIAPLVERSIVNDTKDHAEGDYISKADNRQTTIKQGHIEADTIC